MIAAGCRSGIEIIPGARDSIRIVAVAIEVSIPRQEPEFGKIASRVAFAQIIDLCRWSSLGQA
jgi:hypothetical protein